MLAQVNNAIAFLKQNPRLRELLSARANQLLDACEEKLKQIEAKAVLSPHV